ncbi:MAG: monovalent cation/H+ antiporter subunit D [Gammaproteobacteria bacterium]|nr:monovalent cation/H+ antiporter subunit D [Gammaproteobacteria bacterium]
MNHLVIAPLLLPLITGIALILLRGSANPLRRTLNVASTLALAVVAAALVLQASDGSVQVYRLGDWPAPFGIVLVADRLAALMVIITAVLAAAVLLHAVRGSDRDGRYFHVLFQLQLFGLNGAFLTGDLFNLFVFFEVLLIASYGLLLHGGGPLRTRAGLHFVVINLVGSTLFLFAVGALYGVLGTLNMADLARQAAAVAPDDVGVVRAAGLLLFAVFALKAALAPMHLWLPGAYGNTSLPVAAMFAIMTKVGAYAILRVYSLVFGADGGPVAGLLDPWLLPLALVTVAVGTFGLLASRRLALQAAHLVIVSAGTLLAAFGIGSDAAIAAGLYYLAHTTFAAAALFLLADIIGRARGDLHDNLVTGPVLPRTQLVGGLFLLSCITVAGIPPLSGFFGKLLILQSSVNTPWVSWVFGVLLVTSLLGIMALARSGSTLFFATDDRVATAPAPHNLDLVGVVSLVSAGIVLVVFADPVYAFARDAAMQLLQPGDYIAAVLPGAAVGAAP